MLLGLLSEQSDEASKTKSGDEESSEGSQADDDDSSSSCRVDTLHGSDEDRNVAEGIDDQEQQREC